MAKWATYLISEVHYKETEKYKNIEKVKVHEDNDSSVSAGSIWTREKVITSIDQGYSFCTIYKNVQGKWTKGAKVEKILIDGVYYLRTDANKVKEDNLDKLPEF
ncbi:DUF3892 domain-containing protein [Clostridium sp.]|jgi:hypothetical protein|uniref:DUF3892 domain-containing protein n=1 Tax=Clostridium sp. TaxID=1506 RepID=UPI003EEB2282